MLLEHFLNSYFPKKKARKQIVPYLYYDTHESRSFMFYAY